MTPLVRHPARYGEDWEAPFRERAQRSLTPGAVILDVGSGRRPTLPVADRPPGCTYVGLDAVEEELALADAGSYDETVVADIEVPVPELRDRFDLIVSWQVLEHVEHLGPALENLRSYLRPGGRLVAKFSGRYAAFALVARVVPYRVGAYAMQRLLKVDPDTRFKTHYDHCNESALRPLLANWSEYELLPRYVGSFYFSFAAPLEAAYLVYENWAERRGHSNLATHYILSATR